MVLFVIVIDQLIARFYKGNMLTGKQKKFAVEYVQCLNATEAARRAGYQGGDASLSQIGYENLRKHEVSMFINEAFDDDIMSAREVLRRISQVARADIDDVVDSKGNVDLDKARERGTTGLIKSVKSRNIVSENSDIFEIETVLHDKMRALEILAKYHSLLVDRVRQEDWRTDIIKLYQEGKLSLADIESELGNDFAQELIATVILPSVDAGEVE